MHTEQEQYTGTVQMMEAMTADAGVTVCADERVDGVGPVFDGDAPARTTGSGTLAIYDTVTAATENAVPVPHGQQREVVTGGGTDYRIHRYAQMFPEMTAVEFGELCKLIKRDGLQHRIVLLDGQILDGRQRLRACLTVGEEPQFVNFDGSDPVEFVWRENFARRHLSLNQKAAAVIAYKESLAQEARRRMRQGTKIVAPANRANPITNSYQGSGSAGRTLDKLAAMAGVGRGTVQAVDEVHRRAPELMPAIADGSVPASVASGIARDPALMSQVRDGGLSPTEAANIVRDNNRATRVAKGVASATAKQGSLCDPVSRLVGAAVALRQAGPEVQKLPRGKVRNAPGLAKAINGIGFAFSQLLPLLVQTGDVEAIDLARKTIAVLAETPLVPDPNEPRPDGSLPPEEGPQSASTGKAAATAATMGRSMADMAGMVDWPANGEMKVVLSAPAWTTAMRRARLAAVSDEGKYGSGKIGQEHLGCVRIMAKDGVIAVESSVSQFAARHVVVADGTDAVIVAGGVACVPFRDLLTIVGKPNASHAISIAFYATIPDETIPAKLKDKLPIGEVEIGIVSPNGAVTKSKCYAFSPGKFLSREFHAGDDLDVVFTGKASCMRRPYGGVSFATNPDDPNDIFDKLAVFMTKEDVFFLAADGRRCALCRSKAEKFDFYTCLGEQLPLLIETEYLTPVLSSLSNNDPITLAVARDRGHIYILSGRTAYRIAMVGEQSRENYPTARKIIDMKVGASVLIDRRGLLLAATSLYAVSNDRGSYTFADGSLHLHAKSLAAIKAADAVVPCTWVSDVQLKRTDMVFNTGYLIEGLNRMTSEKVMLMFTPDERKVKIEDEAAPQFSYYIQVIPPPAPAVLPQAESPAESPASGTADGGTTSRA